MAPPAATAPPPPPNVLLLIIDDLRTDLGVYGRDWAQTPHIDRLARASCLFLQAHAAVANCAPSRASLLTGQRPRTHGVLDLRTHVRDRQPGVVTLPQHFRQAGGYLAVSYGKIFHQYLDDAPSWSGQDEFADGHTYRGLRGRAWSRAGGWTRGWAYNEYTTPANRATLREVMARRRRGDYRTGINAAVPRYERGPPPSAEEEEVVVEEASATNISAPATIKSAGAGPYTDARIASLGIRALRLFAARADPTRPWLLALGFVRPHLPLIAPARHWEATREASTRACADADGAPELRGAALSRFTAHHLSGGDGELYDYKGPRPAPTRDGDGDGGRVLRAGSVHGALLTNGYAAAVSFVDAQVGRVTASLDALGQANTTTVVLLSDHGFKLGHLGGHWGKHTLMAADTHVPFLIRPAPSGGGGTGRGDGAFSPRRVRAPVELIDLFPTLCELSGLPPPRASAHRLEGRSLVPLMRGRPSRLALARSAAFSQWPRVSLAPVDSRGGSRGGGAPSPPLECAGYAVRTQGWTLIQWAAPDDDGGDGGGGDGEEAGEEAGAAVNSSSSSSGGGGWRRRQRRRRRECGQHYDLLRVARNASRDGVLREAPVRGHPFVLRALRRRLRTVMGVVL